MIPKYIEDYEYDENMAMAIEALGEELVNHPDDCEITSRLGFNLWYAVAEGYRLNLKLEDTKHYAMWFQKLYHQLSPACLKCPYCCWAFGLGISLFGCMLDLNESEGEVLLDKAGEYDSFWRKMRDNLATQSELEQQFRGKGIFGCYYMVSRNAGK